MSIYPDPSGYDALPQRLPEPQAAAYLGFSPATLRKSRTTGILGGTRSPGYLKLGRRVFYPLTELDTWLGQFEVVENTAQANGGGQ